MSTQGEKTKLLTERWGTSVLEAGFVVVPTLFLKKQAELKLTDGEMMTAINLLAAWWEQGGLPYLGVPQISRRLDISPRTARRHLQKLQEKNLIKAVPNTLSNHDKEVLVTRYDLNPLVEAVQRLAVGARASEGKARQGAAAGHGNDNNNRPSVEGNS